MLLEIPHFPDFRQEVNPYTHIWSPACTEPWWRGRHSAGWHSIYEIDEADWRCLVRFHTLELYADTFPVHAGFHQERRVFVTADIREFFENMTPWEEPGHAG